VQRRELDLGLRLHPDRLQGAHPGSSRLGIGKQGGLARSGFTGENQDIAPTRDGLT